MNQRIGRNSPCYCGSGMKYKKCCLSKDAKDTQASIKAKFQFEPGSYGDIGNFMPSLACIKLTENNERIIHFVLVKPESVFPSEDQAVEEAEKDISEAHDIKQYGGTDAELAMELKKKGYLNMENFNVVGNSELQA